MKCEDVLDTLAAYRHDQDSVQYRRTEQHLQSCPLCRHAAHAVNVLHEARREPVPVARRDAFERAIRAATAEPGARGRAGRPHFWLGVSVGGTLAAGIALALVLAWPLVQAPGPAAVPTVTAALGQVESVDLELASATRLEGAEIRLVLDGAIELEGYEGYRELSWITDLDAGTNRLSLPVVVRDLSGGRLSVVVSTGDGQRSFLVDVRAAGGPPVGRLEGTDSADGRV